MAARSKKSKKRELAELPPSAAADAPIDAGAFLAHTAPVLAALAKSLRERAEASAETMARLEARWEREREAALTAEAFVVYLGGFVDQVAASWMLSAVFVRTLEDHGLLEKNRIAGAGAADSLAAFRRLGPYLNERDYLLAVYGEMAAIPAVAGVFDRDHALFWQLAPSAEAARALLALLTAGGSEAPHYRFGQRLFDETGSDLGPDTRLLGDLYQDLNEAVRKRHALLQTPRFVEAFILDRTLEPAIARFGLDEVTVFDPTCGSGHFLLGAFARLVDHRRRSEPGLDDRARAERALAAVCGADVNPYAVAIARFRLVLAYLFAAKTKRLADAGALPLNLVVANTLLHNAKRFSHRLHGGAEGAFYEAGDPMRLDDPKLAAEILGRGHAAVVGNPPYIVEKDAKLRDIYREKYDSAAGKYALAAPFTEAFFDYAREGGFVGLINANSFMKREFGKSLIEKVLKHKNLTAVVNTAGAYIPGHGTPTVLLFGTAERPQADTVLTVLASRGEPSTPADPEEGKVWRSIADHGEEIGFENDFITVRETARADLASHPWSLAGGGASELKALLEERAVTTLGKLAEAIGRSTHTGEDGIFFMSKEAASCLGVPRDRWVWLVKGEQVRDWGLADDEVCLFPYDDAGNPREPAGREYRYYWRYRTVLRRRRDFGQTIEERGLGWFEHSMFFPDRFLSRLSISFAEVATHNHFVLDRGGKVFKQTAPIIKLPPDASEDEHLALLAYLNSSTACFWMKQVAFPKGGSGIGRGIQDEEWESRFQFDSTKVGSLPVPSGVEGLVPLAREMLELEATRRAYLPESATADSTPDAEEQERRVRRQQVALQERVDWEVYRLFKLVETVPELPAEIDPGLRWFEYSLAVEHPNTAWFARNRYARPSEAQQPSRPTAGVSSEVAIIERPEYKRRWSLVDHRRLGQQRDEGNALQGLEGRFESVGVLRRGELLAALHAHSSPEELDGATLLEDAAVPFVAAYRYTASGMKIRALWEKTWALQRREDAGEDVGAVPVPPKYGQKDYRKAEYWRLRGKLDVPKERFIAYPGCASDEDGEPVYGWAGWDHLERAHALWKLYAARKQDEGWPKERLVPMLAGLLELLPWLLQWHDDPDAGGFRMGQEFDTLLSAECHDLGVTREELAAWRPAESGRRGATGQKKTKAAKKRGPAASEEPEE